MSQLILDLCPYPGVFNGPRPLGLVEYHYPACDWKIVQVFSDMDLRSGGGVILSVLDSAADLGIEVLAFSGDAGWFALVRR